METSRCIGQSKENLPDIARLLLEAYPDGAKQADNEGETPLHLAIENKLPEIARLLLEAYPDGAKQAEIYLEGSR